MLLTPKIYLSKDIDVTRTYILPCLYQPLDKLALEASALETLYVEFKTLNILYFVLSR